MRSEKGFLYPPQDFSLLPYPPIPFPDLHPSFLLSSLRKRIQSARKELKSIFAEGLPLEKTLERIAEIRESVEFLVHLGEHLESVASTPELRRANEKALPLAVRFRTRLLQSPHLYKILRSTIVSDPSLSPVFRRYHKRLLEECTREGAGLHRLGKKRLKEINEALILKTQIFSRNALDSLHAYTLEITDPEPLRGVPPVIVEHLESKAREQGKKGWLLTLDAPLYQAIMLYSPSRNLRQELYRSAVTRATSPPYDNRGLIREILELRREKARLLGYPTFADYVLEMRMAKTKERVREFLLDLSEKVKDRFRMETEEIREFFAHESGFSPEEFMPWDLSFYAERMKEQRFALSEEDLRPYLPLDRVLSGIFSLCKILFDLQIEEIPSTDPRFPPAWHPDVRYFRLMDKDRHERGGFYLDLFPRDKKRSGAWMNGLIVGGPERGKGFKPHLGVICANLTPPTATQPSLLTFSEVETLFHEFGHLLHHLLSDVPLPPLGGTRVDWDFVEVPSQLLENWCYEKEGAKLFFGHQTTGDPLPEEWLKILKARRNFRAATELIRQISYSLLDLELHSEFDPSKEDPVAFAYKLQSRFSPAPLPPDYAMICTFHHLFDDPVGYAAGYYSYKWSEALEADLFRRFAREGVLNPHLGEELKRTILSRGDSEDPLILFRSFMGRDPDPSALLERIFTPES